MHQIFANNENLELNMSKIDLFRIDDLSVDPIKTFQNYYNSTKKRIQKNEWKEIEIEMMQLKSETWFLNAHRLHTLEKLLATYLSNYSQIFMESNDSPVNSNLIISMKHFEQILVFYEQLKAVCRYQNSMRFFEISGSTNEFESDIPRFTDYQKPLLVELKEILNISSAVKLKLPIVKKCINFELM